MTDKENRVRQCGLQVKIAETKVREAQNALEHGYAKAKADMEREYYKLKMDVERAQLELKREESYHETAKAELARGFDA